MQEIYNIIPFLNIARVAIQLSEFFGSEHNHINISISYYSMITDQKVILDVITITNKKQQKPRKRVSSFSSLTGKYLHQQ